LPAQTECVGHSAYIPQESVTTFDLATAPPAKWLHTAAVPLGNGKMPDPIQRVASALGRIELLIQMMFDDLDEAGGGFGWWIGQMDHPKVIFVSDYLMQIAGQVRKWLILAARHEVEFNQTWYTETFLLRSEDRKGADQFSIRTAESERRRQVTDAAVVGFLLPARVFWIRLLAQ
jgi:hypothetical protein